MLLASSADSTHAPKPAVGLLGIPLIADAQNEVLGFEGSTTPAPAVSVGLLFCGRPFRGRFLLWDDE